MGRRSSPCGDMYYDRSLQKSFKKIPGTGLLSQATTTRFQSYADAPIDDGEQSCGYDDLPVKILNFLQLEQSS